MSQRNRIVATAVALVGVLFLAAPSPSRAAGPRPGRVPAVDAWEQIWSWLAGLLPEGVSQRPAISRARESAATSAQGGTGSGLTSPPPPGAQADEGGMINPDGVR